MYWEDRKMLGDIAMIQKKDIYREYEYWWCSIAKEFRLVSGHTEAINFILKLDTVWEYFRTCIIAECKDCWIIDGRIYKKEAET
jgi:hypothetical protein